MAKINYYAVRKGINPGIYDTWDECQMNVKGYSGAEYKGFKTLQEAEKYIAGDNSKDSNSNVADHNIMPDIYAFTDGSFNADTGVYGYGGFLHYNKTEEVEIRGHGNNSEDAVSRNVAGEVYGAIAAMEKAIELGLSEMTLFYDYEGIECWAVKKWKANKKISKLYLEKYEQIKSKLSVTFVHVKAHTGIPGNEVADRIAKSEVGLI